MKRLLTVIVVIALAVFALGLCMGWFHVGAQSGDGKSNITLTVDRDKIEQDRDKATAKLHDLGQQAKDKAVATTQTAQN